MSVTALDTRTPLDRDDARWQAVQHKDRMSDGSFVYAVRSTGVYCRPSCPARRPRRENVRFFLDSAAAERAGYRACRRCQPRATVTRQEALVTRAIAWLDAHVEERVTLPQLAAALGVSRGHLQRTFTRVTGMSPRAYLAARRLDSAKSRLRAGSDVTRALFEAGYGSSSGFYAQVRTELGMTPAIYRRGGEGMNIKFSTTESSFGKLLVAATERGVCAVSFGDDAALLEAALRDEYPQATIQRNEAAVEPYADVVLAHLNERKPLPTLPLDVTGTPFQQKVWQALRQIPAGERRSYGELAAELGAPHAARAVARACAANPAAIVIPCHRVVRGDGGLGGYRWGNARKEALLAYEGDGVTG